MCKAFGNGNIFAYPKQQNFERSENPKKNRRNL